MSRSLGLRAAHTARSSMPRSFRHWRAASAARHASAPRSTVFPARRRQSAPGPRPHRARSPPPADCEGENVSLRLGYKASAEQFGPNELLEFSILAEARGFDSVFISDHFQPWRHTGGHAPFSMAWMGALGARTSRIVMGTSVLTPTFRYHPSVVAQAFGTLGAMFPQRVILGVGTGESLNEVPASGLVWPEPKERTARLKEALALIRQLWSGERVSFQGQYYRTDKATIYDRPAIAPPIYVAAAGPVMAKYAGQFADGFICTSGKAPELYRDTLLPNVAAGIRASGRKPEDIDMMIEMKVSFDSDPARAFEDTRHWAALALSPEEKISVEDPLEME